MCASVMKPSSFYYGPTKETVIRPAAYANRRFPIQEPTTSNRLNHPYFPACHYSTPMPVKQIRNHEIPQPNQPTQPFHLHHLYSRLKRIQLQTR